MVGDQVEFDFANQEKTWGGQLRVEPALWLPRPHNTTPAFLMNCDMGYSNSERTFLRTACICYCTTANVFRQEQSRLDGKPSNYIMSLRVTSSAFQNKKQIPHICCEIHTWKAVTAIEHIQHSLAFVAKVCLGRIQSC